MGVSYSTYVVAGVLARDVISVQKKTKKETKYDPDTGTPYEKETTEFVPLLFGQEEPGLNPSPYEWEYLKRKDTGARRFLGLKVFSTGGEQDTGRAGNPYSAYDYADYVIGVRVNKKQEPMSVFELSFADAALVLAQVGNTVKDLGYHGEVKLFVISHVSY